MDADGIGLFVFMGLLAVAQLVILYWSVGVFHKPKQEWRGGALHDTARTHTRREHLWLSINPMPLGLSIIFVVYSWLMFGAVVGLTIAALHGIRVAAVIVKLRYFPYVHENVVPMS